LTKSQLSLNDRASAIEGLNADICGCFRHSSGVEEIQARMTGHLKHCQVSRPAVLVSLFALASALSGCADVGDTMTTAFADPGKYELYDCKQLEVERKTQSYRMAELQGLMAKAQTGFAGPVVSEMAYRNDYVALQGQAHFADEAWRANKCKDSPPEAAKPVPPNIKPAALPAAAKKKPVARSHSDTAHPDTSVY